MRAPPKSLKREAAGCVEPHAFPLEKRALEPSRRASVSAQADLACGVDDSVPRNPAPGLERAQGVADHPRLARQAREPGDLAVRRDAAAGDARDHGVDPLVTATWHYNLYIVHWRVLCQLLQRGKNRKSVNRAPIASDSQTLVTKYP